MSRMTPEIETIHGVVGITDAFLQDTESREKVTLSLTLQSV